MGQYVASKMERFVKRLLILKLALLRSPYIFLRTMWPHASSTTLSVSSSSSAEEGRATNKGAIFFSLTLSLLVIMVRRWLMDLRRDEGGVFGSELAESVRDMADDDRWLLRRRCGEGKWDEEGEGETTVMMEVMTCWKYQWHLSLWSEHFTTQRESNHLYNTHSSYNIYSKSLSRLAHGPNHFQRSTPPTFNSHVFAPNPF